MASTHDDSFAQNKFYIGAAAVAVLLAALVDSFISPSEEEIAQAAAAPAAVASETKAAASDATAEDNLKPVENIVTVDKDAPPPPARGGAEVYQAACMACHAAGVLNAPKLEAGAWDDRISKGLDGLVTSAINGINSMPPRGGNPNVTDEEMKNAVTYMLDEAGYDLAGGAMAQADAGEQKTDTAAAAVAVAATAAAATTVAVAATDTKAEAAPAAEAETAAAPAADTAEQQTAAAPLADSLGKQVYEATCFTCHDVGIGGSPKIGDNAVWSNLATAGIDSLYNSTLNGKGAMPPKGGHAQLTKEQVIAAVDYMLDAAGVSASEATAEQAPAAAATDTAAEQAPAAAATDTAAEQAAAPANAGIDGEKIYRSLCFSCHDMGIANAPKVGDKAVWEARIAAGMEAIYSNSLNGIGVMPAKGGNPGLSDDEVKAAVDWMVSQSQ